MTPLCRASLEWFAEHGPIGWFDRTAPTDAMRRKLLKDGLIEKIPAKNLRVIEYHITQSGRDALVSRSLTPEGGSE